MIHGTGVDIVSVGRVRAVLERQKTRFIERVFTPGEQKYCEAHRDPAPHYAVRFAAKEAFLKALGTGLRDGISWHDIEVAHDRLGKPELILSGRAIEIFMEQGMSRAFLSLAHDGGMAVATVVLEKT